MESLEADLLHPQSAGEVARQATSKEAEPSPEQGEEEEKQPELCTKVQLTLGGECEWEVDEGQLTQPRCTLGGASRAGEVHPRWALSTPPQLPVRRNY